MGASVSPHLASPPGATVPVGVFKASGPSLSHDLSPLPESLQPEHIFQANYIPRGHGTENDRCPFSSHTSATSL